MKPRSKVVCSICGQLISISNIKAHERRHRDHPETFEVPRYRVDHDGLNCKFCGKACKNRNSLCNHERLCKDNPDKQPLYNDGLGIPNFNQKGRKAWNKGLTKDTCESLRIAGMKISEDARNHPEKRKKPASAETRAILSEIALNGNFETHFGKRSQHVEYKGVMLQSSYELRVAQELDRCGINWVRPKRIAYVDPAGKKHHYTADFYLPDHNVYLDPKNDYLIENVNPMFGYSDCDKIKWVMEQNDVVVLILSEHELDWNTIYEKIRKLHK